MLTIVEYTDQKEPCNRYPRSIVSPTHAKGCCEDNMVKVGKGKEARIIRSGFYGEVTNSSGEVEFEYLRCQVCGFTIRRFPRGALDVVLETTEDLQRVFGWGLHIVVSEDGLSNF